MRIQNLMGSGCSAQLSRNIRGTRPASTLTALGSTQGTALAIMDDYNFFTTVAASTGGLLPSSWAVTDDLIISNMGANALSIYPGVGGAINLLSVNAAFSIPSGKIAHFINSGTDTWVVNLSS